MKFALISLLLTFSIGSMQLAHAQEIRTESVQMTTQDFDDHSGFVPGWVPGWYNPGVQLPPYVWGPQVPYGYWQCVAFNRALVPFYGTGVTINQAAYGAIYYCGGQWAGCFIPQGYCQFRY